ncbi:MAG: hypothetical protein R2911_31625 [Caldilineaceae bacterium]
MRIFRQQGAQTPPIEGNTKPWQDISFNLGSAHPVYTLLGDNLATQISPPYAWYLRVPDVPAFIQHVAPVLEERLAQSILVGYSGALAIDFYRSGLRLHFEQGLLKAVEPWRLRSYRRRRRRISTACLFATALRLSQPGRANGIFPRCMGQRRGQAANRHAVPQAAVHGVCTDVYLSGHCSMRFAPCIVQAKVRKACHQHKPPE